MRLHGADIPPDVGSVLIVDLAAIAANYRHLQSLAPGAEVGASIKADAYGLGVEQVAPALAAAGCRTFFVATAAEGVRVRAVAGEADIVVLNGPERGSAAQFADHRLIPALNSLPQIDIWRESVAGGAPSAAYLHLDTGMSRLGLGADETAALAGDGARLKGIDVQVVMSHLACADEPASPMNAQQRERLLRAAAALKPVTGPARLSLANSAGIFLGADYHFDQVRAGAALYGLNVLNQKVSKMEQVAYLYAKIIQTRDIDKAATVGYGAVHRTDRRRRVATVATGYADGYLRAAGQRGAPDDRPAATAYIGDRPAPVIGRVSMDLLTIDVTDIPEDAAQPGRFVELIGAHVSADELADAAGTIGYEVLTRLGPRHYRVYRGETTA